MSQLIFQLTEVRNTEQLEGPFYVIEFFPIPQFVTNEDGFAKTFYLPKDALDEAEDCQEGYVLVM